jgi:epoxyqueuosine reductase
LIISAIDVLERLDRNAAPLVCARRVKQRVIQHGDRLLGGLTLSLASNLFDGGGCGWTERIPGRPRWFRPWPDPPVWPDRPVWPDATLDTPASLRSYAGVLRDPAAEQRAFEERPLHIFNGTHREAATWTFRHSWSWLVAPYPALRRAITAVARTKTVATASRTAGATGAALSALILEEARRIGLSTVGFAKADVKYTYAESDDPGDANVIVCVLEQDWRATQTAPSSPSERSAFRAYGQVFARAAALAEFVKSLGHDARVGDFGGGGITIHYAVEAGLGQLGLNGQLLTPAAGSRLRLALIMTDAPVQLGRPVDYGIPRLCDECRLCVRRCPPGAIPGGRAPKRGVVKAAIKPERCFPIVAQAHGCAICMKVCPVQRYGLGAVTDHYVRTGQILGKGTDELEGFVWPLDGRYYGPGRKPRMSSAVLHPSGWHFDRNRTAPLDAAGDAS